MDVEIFSFFSGLGFLDMGFENNGFNIVFVNEINPYFLRAYQYGRRQSNHVPFYGYSNRDVRDYLSDEFWFRSFPGKGKKKLIGFIGGPPCPDFSIAGKNNGKDGENGQLTSVYTQLIIARKPDFFVLENVKGLYQTQKHRQFYNIIKTQLLQAGYCLFDSIENALEYGVPQYRDRLFLAGFLCKRFGREVKCSLGSHKKYCLSQIIDLPWPTIAPFEVDSKYECPANIIKDLTVEHWFVKNKVLNHPNQYDIFKVKNREKYYNIYEGATAGKSFKRLHRWRYSPTAAYGNNEVHLHPYQPRRISIAEALAIQSAPASFSLPDDIPLSSKFKMVGNAVPVLLAQGIANDVLDTINNTLIKE